MKESSHYFLASSLSSAAAWPEHSPAARAQRPRRLLLRAGSRSGLRRTETAHEMQTERRRP